jgi:hypothetical protein
MEASGGVSIVVGVGATSLGGVLVTFAVGVMIAIGMQGVSLSF